MDLVAMPAVISKEDYNSFHAIDRNLYAILVTQLWRDPFQAMKVMALWLWLEHIGFPDIVKKILALPKALINELVDEALACLNFIYGPPNPFPTQITEINLTNVLVQRDVSFGFFSVNKEAAKVGLEEINREICQKALTDIMTEAIARNSAHSALIQGMASLTMEPPQPQMALIRSQGLVHPDDRTMFVTFSKGYPVTEHEVRLFFGAVFGDCIQSFHMQEVDSQEQPLFARIVFYRPAIIDIILNGQVKAKFTISGKHVWMRRFIPRSERH